MFSLPTDAFQNKSKYGISLTGCISYRMSVPNTYIAVTE